MGLGEALIRQIDWSKQSVLQGSGEDYAQALEEFLGSTSSDAAERTWWHLENVVFSQDTVYGAAEVTVEVALAALADDRPAEVRSWILELLHFLLKGGSTEDPGLPTRCRERALRGVWLLAREAALRTGLERELIVSMLDQVDPATADLVRGLPAGGSVER